MKPACIHSPFLLIVQKGSDGRPEQPIFMRLCHKGLGQAWLGEKRIAAVLTGVMEEVRTIDPCV